VTKDEALDLALEALEMCEVPWTGTLDHNLTEAITAIKQARSTPPTHKTARWTDEEYREISDQVISTLVEYGAELRTADCQMQILREELDESRREVAQLKAQRQWFCLTDEEAIDIGTQCQWYDGDCERFDSIGFARAIEAKLKEKNT
jgi:predicted RNase H-like nuclease (RuvC/YqgF family)